MLHGLLALSSGATYKTSSMLYYEVDPLIRQLLYSLPWMKNLFEKEMAIFSCLAFLLLLFWV